MRDRWRERQTHTGSVLSGVRNRVAALDGVERFEDRSPASGKPLRRIHWISPIHTDTRANSAA
jgi:hypothetical protein